jgi:hypothetical protein
MTPVRKENAMTGSRPEVEIVNVFCPRCRREHVASVRLVDGFPETEWLEPHTRDLAVRLATASDELLGLGLDLDRWDLIDRAADALLELNDPDEDLS